MLDFSFFLLFFVLSGQTRTTMGQEKQNHALDAVPIAVPIAVPVAVANFGVSEVIFEP